MSHDLRHNSLQKSIGEQYDRPSQQNSNMELVLRRQGLWFAAGDQFKSPTPTAQGTTVNQVSEMRLPTISPGVH